jgi:predicted nucleic acid-binding Zn ribbon protein
MSCPTCNDAVRPGRKYCSPRCSLVALNRSPDQRAKASAKMRAVLSNPARRRSLGAAISRGHIGHVPLDLRGVHHTARKAFGRAYADSVIAEHLAAEKRRARGR